MPDEKDPNETVIVPEETGEVEAPETPETTTEETTKEEKAPTETDTDKESGELTEADLDKARGADEARKAAIEKAKAGTEPKIQEKIDRAIGDKKAAREEARLAREAAEAAKIEAAYLKGQLEALQKQGIKPQTDQGTASTEPVRPRMKDFDDQDAYEVAVDKYDKDIRLWDHEQWQKGNDRQTQAQKDKAEAERLQEVNRVANAKIQERSRKVLADITSAYGEEAANKVTDEKFTISVAMRDAALSGESPAKVILFLAEHKDIFNKIKGIQDPERQRREVYKLEAAITGKELRTSNAVKPITRVQGGSDSVINDEKYASDHISTEERIAISQARKAKEKAKAH